MKRTILISAALGLALGAVSASADDSKGSDSGRSWSAESHQWHKTHLPRRFQSANVIDVSGAGKPYQGASWIIRSKNGIEGRIMSKVTRANRPYTVWMVVFNNADACATVPCGESDLGNPDVRGCVYYGSAAISSEDGLENGIINVDFNMMAGQLPTGLFVLIPELPGCPKGLARGNGFNAELHVVGDIHPAIGPGEEDQWLPDLTTTNLGTGPRPAFNDVAAIFVPCPDPECPASIL